MSDSCLHLQAIELCLEHNAFIVCQSTQLNEVTYYLLNERAIFIPKNEEYHHYYLKKGAWNCNTCPKICKMSSIVQAIEIALKIGHGISTSPIFTSIEYPTISTQWRSQTSSSTWAHLGHSSNSPTPKALNYRGLSFSNRCSSPEYTPTGIYPGIIWARTEYT